MKLILLLLAAALSALPAAASTRPHYGGTLRVEVRGSLASFEIGEHASADRMGVRDLMLMSVCDRLTRLDDRGEPQPSLARSWRTERDGRTWFFTIRTGVLLQNGSTLTPQMVITALTAANPAWRLRADGPQILVQSDSPLPDLPYELAEPRNSICLAGEKGEWVGSGPFAIGEFQKEQRVELRAFDDSWRGRPFLDRVRIEMAKSLSDQAADFQLGKTDLIEADPTQQRPPGNGALASQPTDLFALVFPANRPASSDPKLRAAIALAIDRNSIFTVLLRRQGEPNAALLPEWISGYAHVFEAAQDLPTARRLRNETTVSVPLSLTYPPEDALAKLIAERVAVNAREVGITLQPVAGELARPSSSDIRLVLLRIHTPDAAAALPELGSALDMASLEKAHGASSVESLYAIESEALKDYSVIPLAHIPRLFNPSPIVHDLVLKPWGDLNLADAWVDAR